MSLELEWCTRVLQNGFKKREGKKERRKKEKENKEKNVDLEDLPTLETE